MAFVWNWFGASTKPVDYEHVIQRFGRKETDASTVIATVKASCSDPEAQKEVLIKHILTQGELDAPPNVSALKENNVV